MGAPCSVPTCRGGEITGQLSARHPPQKGPLTAMQIRLTVLAPRSGRSVSEARSCDVLVTAPAGAPLATVASGSGHHCRRTGRSGLRQYRSVRRPAALGPAALRIGGATADGRRGAVPPGPRRRGGAGSCGRRAAPCGRRTRRGRCPPAARRSDPDRPLRRGGRAAGRPRCVTAALRGDGRGRRPGHRRRPGLDERHHTGRRRCGRTPGPSRSRSTAEDG